MILTLWSSGQEPCRLEYQQAQCNALLYIDEGGRHQVRAVYPYWLRASAANRSSEDYDGLACSFTGVPTGSSEEDLENTMVSTK